VWEAAENRKQSEFGPQQRHRNLRTVGRHLGVPDGIVRRIYLVVLLMSQLTIYTWKYSSGGNEDESRTTQHRICNFLLDYPISDSKRTIRQCDR